jgi:hypothetical protein
LRAATVSPARGRSPAFTPDTRTGLESDAAHAVSSGLLGDRHVHLANLA